MAAITFSEYSLDFLAYRRSFLDVLEGTTGAGKTVVAIYKFIDRVYHSTSKNHIISCMNTMKAEQNIITDPNCGAIAMFESINSKGETSKLVEYFPNGKGLIKTSHLVVHGKHGEDIVDENGNIIKEAEPEDKIVYFISYDDSTKWANVRAGRYGCIFIDECNLVRNNTPGEVPQFITECLSRADDYIVMTLNPDDPEKEVYQIINQARPIKKYKKKGPKEIRNLLNLEENKEYKWWFFDFYDNPSMTEERIRRTKEGCKSNKKDWNSRILGLRTKTSNLAFPGFDDDFNTITKEEVLKRKNDTKEHLKEAGLEKIVFRSFFGGVDTSYSSLTDDLISFMFCGITTKGEVYILDEFAFNNRDVKNEADKLSASKLVPMLIQFLSKNSKEWGYPEFTFVDEADQNLLLEVKQYNLKNQNPFKIRQSVKHKFPITARLKKINELINNRKYFVVNTCYTHIHEMNVMALNEKDKNKPEDRNNHTYDAMCYAIEKAYLQGHLGLIQ